MKHELDSCKQSLAQSELTSHQLHTTSEMREADYNSAIKSRDEALRDAKALAARIESLEEALQQQVSKAVIIFQFFLSFLGPNPCFCCF